MQILGEKKMTTKKPPLCEKRRLSEGRKRGLVVFIM